MDLVAELGYREADASRFEAAWDRLEAAYINRLEAAVEEFEDWRGKLRGAAEETVRLAEEHPRQARFLAVDSLAAGEVGRRRQRVLAARLGALLDTAREQLEDPDSVPEATSRWVVGIFFDRIYRRFSGAGGPDLVSQLPELMFLAVSSYFGTEAGLEELVAPP
jgi:hypothetical protein